MTRKIKEISEDLERIIVLFPETVQNSWIIVSQNLKPFLRDKFSPWFFDTPFCQVSLHLIHTGMRQIVSFARRFDSDTMVSPLVLELIIKLDSLKRALERCAIDCTL